MKKLYYSFLLLFAIASCHDKNTDSDIFNGEIKINEDTIIQQEIEFKELVFQDPNFGEIAIQDSLAFFMNPKLSTHWYQVFDLNNNAEIGRYVNKGNGHKEFSPIAPIFNFYIENNDTKTVLFEANKERISVWNITKSLTNKSTVIEKQIKMPWMQENNGACFNEIFVKDSCTVYAKVSAISTENQDATLPYYQIRDLRNGEKKSEIHVFKKDILDKKTKYQPEVFYSHDVIKPDGSKIAQAMLHVPQINIIDTKSGTAVAYQLNYHMTLSDLETYEDLKTYFIRICADNEYIYTVFYGKEPWGLYDIPCVNQIYIFDWNGNLIKKILTKHCIDNIAVDHVNKILYTTSPMDEKLYYIKTNELIGKN